MERHVERVEGLGFICNKRTVAGRDYAANRDCDLLNPPNEDSVVCNAVYRAHIPSVELPKCFSALCNSI